MLGVNLLDIEDIKSEIIVKDFIPLHKGNYNILTGDGGVGKSQVALKILAHFLQANPNERAVAIFTEDTKAVIKERLSLIIRNMRITLEEIIERTFFKTLDNADGKTFVSKLQKQNVLNEEYVTKFITNGKFHKVGLVILDPLEAFHLGLSENDAEDMKFLTVNVFQRLGVEMGACVLVLHHTAKGNTGGARGSGVITNKGRVAYNLRKIREMNKDLGIEVTKKGWEHSVLLSTIKDNHYISQYCSVMKYDNGKLDLPVVDNNLPVEIIEYKE